MTSTSYAQGVSAVQPEVEQVARRYMVLPTVALRFSVGGQRIDSLFDDSMPISLLGGVALYSLQTRGPYAAVMLEQQHYRVYDQRKARFVMPVLRLGWSWSPEWPAEERDLGRAMGRLNVYAMGSFRPRSLSRRARVRTGLGVHVPALTLVGGFGNMEVSSEWGDGRPATWVFSYGWSF